MRAVITGTDFIKDVDGSFKAIETNTNVGLTVDVTRYIDFSNFTQFVTDNGFNEIIVVHNPTNLQINNSGVELEETNENFRTSHNLLTLLKQYYSGSLVDVSGVKLDETAITIPVIEDDAQKLIIRTAYDTTALIDDIYARDNWEFLKLMYDSNPSSIPATYINDTELGFDSIGTTLRDNGNHPNYCVKKRITPADNNVYPKLLKITTLEQLDTIKQNLSADEYIQEYIFNSNDLLDNKTKVYRSVDMVYGSELDTLNLWIMEQSNLMEIVDTPDYDDNNEIQIWDRNRYTTKYNAKTSDTAIKLSADENTKILDSNNNIIQVQNIEVSDSLKSINIAGLDTDMPEFDLLKWTGSVDTVLGESYVTSSNVVSIIERPYFGEIIEMVLENGTIFSDVPHAMILVEKEISGSTVTKFTGYENLSIGMNVFVWDNQTDTMIKSEIISLEYSYQNLNGYTLNIEEVDTFLTLEESDGNRYGLITHNYDYDCRQWSCPGDSAAQYIPANTCRDCYSGGWNPYDCNNAYACCRDYFWYNRGPQWSTCQWWEFGCNVGYTEVELQGYCNGSKPSDVGLKTEIRPVDVVKGLKLYKFKYNEDIIDLWKEETGEDLTGVHIGVLAQELIGTEYESALSKHEKGFYIVDYNKLPQIEL